MQARVDSDNETDVSSADSVGPFTPLLSPTTANPPVLTDYSLRYGPAISNKYLRSKGKSGFTPLDPPDATDLLSPRSTKRFRSIVRYQRWQLGPLTTWEMMDCGSLVKEDAVESNLKGSGRPLHTMLQRDKWKAGTIPLPTEHLYQQVTSLWSFYASNISSPKTSAFPDGDPNLPLRGVWGGDDDRVWEAIRPILSLVSLFLGNSLVIDWFGDLLFGPKTIEKNPNGTSRVLTFLETINPRDPTSKLKERGKVIEALKDPSVVGNMTFGFESFMDDRTRTESDQYYALTRNYGIGKGLTSEISLAFETYIPLLDNRAMTKSERLFQQFLLAFVIIHELAHAIGGRALNRPVNPNVMGFPRQLKRDSRTYPEPFYDQDEVGELGWALEKVILGGCISVFQQRVRRADKMGVPFMAGNISNFPNYQHHYIGSITSIGASISRKCYRHPERFGPGAIVDTWPISMAWLQDLQQLDFWSTTVANFGPQAFRIPKIIGSRFTKGQRPQDQEKMTVLGPDYYAWIDATGRPRAEADMPPQDAEEFKLWEAKNLRNVKSNAIRVALRKQHQDLLMLERDRRAVAQWQARRARNLVALSTTGRNRELRVNEARRRIILLETEIAAMQAAIKAENNNADLIDEDKRLEDAVHEMLNEARGLANSADEAEAYKLLTSVLNLTKWRFHEAQAHVILASLSICYGRLDHIHLALDHFRSLQFFQDPSGNWDKWIEEARAVETSIIKEEKENEIEAGIRDANIQVEQLSVNEAYKAYYNFDERRCARLCYPLLQSHFRSIRAQAHLIIADLQITTNRRDHALQALKQLTRLQRRSPDLGDWSRLIVDAQKILTQFPESLEQVAPHDDSLTLAEEQKVLEDAMDTQDDGNEAEATRIFRQRLLSKHGQIRAQAHLSIAELKSTGDRIFRYYHAQRALECFQRLLEDESEEDFWNSLLIRTIVLLVRMKAKIRGASAGVVLSSEGKKRKRGDREEVGSGRDKRVKFEGRVGLSRG